MDPKTERFFIVSILGVILLASAFSYHFFTFKHSQISKAKAFLAEHKVAMALDILEKTRAKLKKKDLNLEMLMLYALVKSKRFAEADLQIENVEYVPKNYHEQFKEIIDILSINEESKLIAKLIAKSHKIKFDEDYFIELSKQRNSLEAEMKILEEGLVYIREKLESHKSPKKKNDKELATRKLEDYIFKRCIEDSNYYIGCQDYKTSLIYLEKAKKLKVIGDSTLKDDYYFNLALTHKNLGNITQAWDNMQIAAKLGSSRAKSMIKALNEKFSPEDEDKKNQKAKTQ
jgi:hypothetical protein